MKRASRFNAKRNNRMIDQQALDEKMSKVKNYCSDEKNFKVPVAMCGRLRVGKAFLHVLQAGRCSHVFGLLVRFT